jgi:putative SOS response-associated peptidase YedK
MCGRFTHRYTWSEIHALYRLTTPPANLQPRYNVWPTTTIAVAASAPSVGPHRRLQLPRIKCGPRPPAAKRCST